MGPRTDVEMIMCPVILISLSCFNAWLFGDMSILTEQNSQKSNDFQAEVDTANEAMHNWTLPNDMTTEIRNYLIQNQGTKSEQLMMKTFMS